MRKKSQYHAVPIILLTLLGVVIIYLLMVYPSERYRLLFGNLTEENVTTGGEAEVVFQQGDIGLVGKSFGQQLDTIYITRVTLNYPLKQQEIKSVSPFFLKSTPFRSGLYVLNVKNLDIDKTDTLILKIQVGDVTGTPKLSVKVNDTVIHLEKVVSDQTLTISIPKSLLSKDTSISIIAKFGGLNFWQPQVVNIDSLKVEQFYYDSTKPSDLYRAVLTKDPSTFGSMIFKFDTKSEGQSSKLLIKMNNVTIYEDVPSDGEHTIHMGTEGLFLKKGDNNIYFETEKGGVYTLRDLDFRFYAPETGEAIQKVIFNIPNSVFVKDKKVTLVAEIGNIIIPGALEFFLDYPTVSYILDVGTVGGEVSVELNDPKSELRPFGNSLTLSSPDGRFYINEVKVIVGEVPPPPPPLPPPTGDTENPVISFSEHTPDIVERTEDVKFTLSAVDNVALDKAIFVITLPNGTLFTDTESMTGKVQTLRYYYTTELNGTYNYEITVYDTSNNTDAVSGSFDVFDTTPPTITFVPPTPLNNSLVQPDYIVINVTISEPGFVILEWNDSIGINESQATDEFISVKPNDYNVYFVALGLELGEVHTFRINARDDYNNWAMTEKRTITVATEGVPPPPGRGSWPT